jgi:hypothetical protein
MGDENHQEMFRRLLNEFVGAAPDGVDTARALAVQLCIVLNADGTSARTAALRTIKTVLISVATAENEVDLIMAKIDDAVWPASNGLDVVEQLARAGRA